MKLAPVLLLIFALFALSFAECPDIIDYSNPITIEGVDIAYTFQLSPIEVTVTGCFPEHGVKDDMGIEYEYDSYFVSLAGIQCEITEQNQKQIKCTITPPDNLQPIASGNLYVSCRDVNQDNKRIIGTQKFASFTIYSPQVQYVTPSSIPATPKAEFFVSILGLPVTFFDKADNYYVALQSQESNEAWELTVISHSNNYLLLSLPDNILTTTDGVFALAISGCGEFQAYPSILQQQNAVIVYPTKTEGTVIVEKMVPNWFVQNSATSKVAISGKNLAAVAQMKITYGEEEPIIVNADAAVAESVQFTLPTLQFFAKDSVYYQGSISYTLLDAKSTTLVSGNFVVITPIARSSHHTPAILPFNVIENAKIDEPEPTLVSLPLALDTQVPQLLSYLTNIPVALNIPTVGDAPLALQYVPYAAIHYNVRHLQPSQFTLVPSSSFLLSNRQYEFVFVLPSTNGEKVTDDLFLTTVQNPFIVIVPFGEFSYQSNKSDKSDLLSASEPKFTYLVPQTQLKLDDEVNLNNNDFYFEDMSLRLHLYAYNVPIPTETSNFHIALQHSKSKALLQLPWFPEPTRQYFTATLPVECLAKVNACEEGDYVPVLITFDDKIISSSGNGKLTTISLHYHKAAAQRVNLILAKPYDASTGYPTQFLTALRKIYSEYLLSFEQFDKFSFDKSVNAKKTLSSLQFIVHPNPSQHTSVEHCEGLNFVESHRTQSTDFVTQFSHDINDNQSNLRSVLPEILPSSQLHTFTEVSWCPSKNDYLGECPDDSNLYLILLGLGVLTIIIGTFIWLKLRSSNDASKQPEITPLIKEPLLN